MSCVVHWFRQDLRLSDHPVLLASIRSARDQGLPWLPVFVAEAAHSQPTDWVATRMGPQRQAMLSDALAALDGSLQALGSRLMVMSGDVATELPALMQRLSARELWTEHLPAPEEEAADNAISAAALRAGWVLVRRYQSGLFDLADLPFDAQGTPDVFTPFRHLVERAGTQAPAPAAAPHSLPPLPPTTPPPRLPRVTRQVGEDLAQAHWRRYLERGLPHTYKATRNGLSGPDFSTRLSPWLAWGSLSARQAQHALQAWEAEHGASDSSGWITFELLWREHFRLMHLKHGRKLYRARGLSQLPTPAHNPAAFERWCQGRTGQPLVDAGMRELAATGWLSNRMRQIVASFLIHDLRCDWRAGADWFESQLIDFDVFSNQGNWLYIAGRGTDPRGGRRFDPLKQTREHDPEGSYRRLWGTA